MNVSTGTHTEHGHGQILHLSLVSALPAAAALIPQTTRDFSPSRRRVQFKKFVSWAVAAAAEWEEEELDGGRMPQPLCVARKVSFVEEEHVTKVTNDTCLRLTDICPIHFIILCFHSHIVLAKRSPADQQMGSSPDLATLKGGNKKKNQL